MISKNGYVCQLRRRSSLKKTAYRDGGENTCQHRKPHIDSGGSQKKYYGCRDQGNRRKLKFLPEKLREVDGGILMGGKYPNYQIQQAGH